MRLRISMLRRTPEQQRRGHNERNRDEAHSSVKLTGKRTPEQQRRGHNERNRDEAHSSVKLTGKRTHESKSLTLMEYLPVHSSAACEPHNKKLCRAGFSSQ